jgi:hypothetical protein
MRIWRFLGRFAGWVISWWTVVVGLLTYLGVAFWRSIYHSPLYGKVILAVALVVAVVILIRDRRRFFSRAKRFFEDLRHPAMTKEHEDYLRQVAARLGGNISTNRPLDYGNPPRNERNFGEHFPGLRARLKEWEQSVLAETKAKAAAYQRAYDEVADMGKADPLLMTSGILRNVAAYLETTLTRRGSDTPDPPIILRLEDDDAFMGRGITWVDLPHVTFVASRDTLEPSLDNERMESIRVFMDGFVRSPEFAEAKRTRDVRSATQATTTEALRSVLERVHLRGHCDDCRSLRRDPLYEVAA